MVLHYSSRKQTQTVCLNKIQVTGETESILTLLVNSCILSLWVLAFSTHLSLKELTQLNAGLKGGMSQRQPNQLHIRVCGWFLLALPLLPTSCHIDSFGLFCTLCKYLDSCTVTCVKLCHMCKMGLMDDNSAWRQKITLAASLPSSSEK